MLSKFFEYIFAALFVASGWMVFYSFDNGQTHSGLTWILVGVISYITFFWCLIEQARDKWYKEHEGEFDDDEY